MATQVTNYQCPSCTGPLRFDGNTGKLVCDYCGSQFEVAEIEKLYAAKDRKARENFEIANSKPKNEDDWDVSYLSSDWGADAEKMKAYDCPSCGAQLICDENTSATSCPYCGNPSIVPGQFAGVLKPDFVIPFKKSKDDAVKALENYYRGKKFLPDAFTKNNKIQEIQGVYVPFWLFDGEVDVDMTFDAVDISSYRSGDYQITEKRFFELIREGTVPFEKIPVDASTKMPDTHMDAVEPFDYKELKPFSTAYLPGYLADRYDLKVEDCSPRADQRAEKTAVDVVTGSVSRYESVTMTSKRLNLKRGKVSYALLPVYMLNTKWNGNDYLFAMNGQTGKFIGNLPVDNGKYWKTFMGITAAVTAVLGTIIMFTM